MHGSAITAISLPFALGIIMLGLDLGMAFRALVQRWGAEAPVTSDVVA